MTLQELPVKVPIYKVLDPNVDLVSPSERKYYVTSGSADITYRQYTAQGNGTTTNNVIFSNIRPPSGVLTDVRTRWQCSIFVDFSGLLVANLPNASILSSNAWGLRSFPLANMVNTMSLKLNNTSITTTLSQYHRYLMRFGSTPDDRNRYMSGSPSFMDDVSGYTVPVASTLSAGGRWPFSYYSTNNTEITRQINPWITSYTLGTGAQANLLLNMTITLEEPFFVNPFQWSSSQRPAIPHLTSLDVVLQMGPSVPKRIFCGGFVNGTNYVGVPPAFYDPACVYSFSNARLLTKYYQLQSAAHYEPLYILPFYQINDQIDSSNNAVANFSGYAYPETWNGVPPTPVSYTSNVYTLSTVPDAIYIFGRPQQSFMDADPTGYMYSDTPIRFESLQIKWNVRDVLNGATEKDLFNLATFKQSDGAYPEWLKYNGSILCIDPVLAFGTYPLEVAGVAESITFQFTATYINIGYLSTNVLPIPPIRGAVPVPATLVYEFHVVFVDQGILTMKENWSQTTTGLLLASDLLAGNISETEHGAYEELHQGGRRNFSHHFVHHLKKHAPHVAHTAHQVAGLIEHVIAPHMTEEMGGRRRRVRRGGAIMDCDSLESRL